MIWPIPMSEKIYIVTLHKKEDLEGFYSEMAENGFRLNMKRPMSRCTHYWMNSVQAEELKQDPRVWDVELNPEDAGYDMVRHSYPTSLNHSTIQYTGQYWKDGSGVPSIDPNLDNNWGLFHHCGVYGTGFPTRDKNSFGVGAQSRIGDDIIWHNDGSEVDVVICDDPVSSDCGEWLNRVNRQPLQGAGSTNRFVEYQWFNNLNSAVSSIDDDGQTLPTGAVTYYTNGTNTVEHGTHVAGTVAGGNYGWASAANIYGLQVLGTMPSGQSLPGLLIFDYLRAFHSNKTIDDNLGIRRPTITNHSWGYGIKADPETFPNGITINDIIEIQYRGIIYNSTNPGPSGWNSYGIELDFGVGQFKTVFPVHFTAINADIEDAIEDGVVIVAAAGNDNFNTVLDGEADWNNFVRITGINGGAPIYFNRGSSPASSPNAISVGAVSNYANQRRATFTNYGTGVDIFAAGQNIISCWPNPATITGDYAGIGLVDPKYSQGSGDWVYPISGTSMASPQVAGILACAATGKNRFTQEDAFGVIERGHQENLMTFDIGVGGGSTATTYDVTVTAPSSSFYTLNGQTREGTISGNDINVRIFLGDTINFNLSGVSGIHPFRVRQTPNGSDVNNPTIPNQGATGTTTVSWTPTTAGTYYYQCGVHASMLGVIQVEDFTSPPPGTFVDDSCSAGTANNTIEYKFTRWQGTADWSGGGISGVADDFKGRRKLNQNSLAFPRRNTLFQPMVSAPPASQTYTFSVGNSGASHYVLSGSDRNTTHSSANDPTLNINAGDIIEFNVNATGHPFLIKTSPVTGTGSQLPSYQGSGSGVLNNGTVSGTVTLYTSGLSGTTLYYICQFHGGMVGSIIIA